MRVMILAKSTPQTENAGHDPDGAQAMGRFHQELVDAGILLAADALQPSGKGARVRFRGRDRHVIDGPFVESKELVAGYWIWQVASLDEAIEWVKRAPFADGQELEVRPIFEPDELPSLTPELDERTA
jgi:hypothetical protein